MPDRPIRVALVEDDAHTRDGLRWLIDNSEGVVLEGRQLGFRVLHVRPDDLGWAEVVRAAVG